MALHTELAEGWFFGTPMWAAYLAAYGRPHASHTGPHGNLIVRLGQRDLMWANISKGHRADIGAASHSVSVTFGDFERYRSLHQELHGEARPGATFDLMRTWMPEYGVAATTGDAAAYFIRYGPGVYYASAARRRNARRGAGHLIIWRAMCRLADEGSKWLDMGPAPSEDASEKERRIGAFKEHFGAERISPWSWEL